MCREEKGLLISSIAIIILINVIFCVTHQLFLNHPEWSIFNSGQKYNFIAAVYAAEISWFVTWVSVIILAFCATTVLAAFVANFATAVALVIFAELAKVDAYAALAIVVACIATHIAYKNINIPEEKKYIYITLVAILIWGIIALKVFVF